MSWITDLLGMGGGTNSESQLQDAQAAQSRGHGHELEALARSRGFNSAEEMLHWSRQRNTPSGGTVPDHMSNMDTAKMIHPKYLLEYISKRYSDAVNGGQ